MTPLQARPIFLRRSFFFVALVMTCEVALGDPDRTITLRDAFQDRVFVPDSGVRDSDLQQVSAVFDEVDSHFSKQFALPKSFRVSVSETDDNADVSNGFFGTEAVTLSAPLALGIKEHKKSFSATRAVYMHEYGHLIFHEGIIGRLSVTFSQADQAQAGATVSNLNSEIKVIGAFVEDFERREVQLPEGTAETHRKYAELEAKVHEESAIRDEAFQWMIASDYPEKIESGRLVSSFSELFADLVAVAETDDPRAISEVLDFPETHNLAGS